MKSEYQRIKEEISETVRKAQAAEALKTQQIEDCRKRYNDAQDAMSAALNAGDREGYHAAGMTAESARLDLEFFEKSRNLERKAAASNADDVRVRTALKTEAANVKTELYTKLKALFTEASSLCNDAVQRLNEIDAVSGSWNTTVMRKPNEPKCCPDQLRLEIRQFTTAISAQLNRFNYLKGE